MTDMNLLAVGPYSPDLDESVWVADNARVVGHVKLAEDVSVWFGAVVRGDQAEPIEVGARSNIQDGAVLHSDPGQPLRASAPTSRWATRPCCMAARLEMGRSSASAPRYSTER